jgi:hypothetical protein
MDERTAAIKQFRPLIDYRGRQPAALQSITMIGFEVRQSRAWSSARARGYRLPDRFAKRRGELFELAGYRGRKSPGC